MKSLYIFSILLLSACGSAPSGSNSGASVTHIASFGSPEPGIVTQDNCPIDPSLIGSFRYDDGTGMLTIFPDCSFSDTSTQSAGIVGAESSAFTMNTFTCNYSITDLATTMASAAYSNAMMGCNASGTTCQKQALNASAAARQQYAGKFRLTYNCGLGTRSATIQR